MVPGDGVGSDPGAPPELGFLLIVDISELEELLKVKTGDRVEAAASGLRVDVECPKVTPLVPSGLVTDGLRHGPSAGVGVPVMLGESPVSPCCEGLCSGVELLVVAETEPEPEMLLLDFTTSVSSSVFKGSAVMLGSEVKAMLLGTGTERLKDLVESNPDVPQSKTRQTFQLHCNIVPKYLKTQKQSRITDELSLMWRKLPL